MEILKLTRTTLTDAEANSLRSWFEKGDCERLKEIAKGKIREHSALATNKALDSKETNSYAEGASVEIKKAQRYMDFLSVLEEIIATKKDFEIVSLK